MLVVLKSCLFQNLLDAPWSYQRNVDRVLNVRRINHQTHPGLQDYITCIQGWDIEFLGTRWLNANSFEKNHFSCYNCTFSGICYFFIPLCTESRKIPHFSSCHFCRHIITKFYQFVTFALHQIRIIIIHLKYFPNSDWLKAHAAWPNLEEFRV